jgi:hypothetical protein
LFASRPSPNRRTLDRISIPGYLDSIFSSTPLGFQWAFGVKEHRYRAFWLVVQRLEEEKKVPLSISLRLSLRLSPAS